MAVKKYIGHMKRTTALTLEAAGIIAAICIIIWVGLIVRLMQGPMNADMLTSAIARGMHAQNPAFNFSLGKTLLTWGGTAQPFVFEINNVQVSRVDGTPVVFIEKIGVRFSKINLIIGRFIPRVIHIYGPAVRIVRTENGFDLNVNAAASNDNQAPAPSEDPISREDFVRAVFARLSGAGSSDILAGLDRITVRDAAILYEDKVLNVSLRSRRAAMTFTRGEENILAEVEAEVDAEGAEPSQVRLRASFGMKTPQHVIAMAFSGFNPARHLKESAFLQSYAGFDLPLKGAAAIELDQDFMPLRTRFSLDGGEGAINAFGLYPPEHPLPVKSMGASGYFDFAQNTGALEEVSIDFNGPSVAAQAKVTHEESDNVLHLSALLENMPMDQLKFYWPEKLAPDPRAWVTQNLSVGTATQATLDMSMVAPQGDWDAMRLKDVGGKIDFKGIKVNYFSPLMPVMGVDGQATYDRKSFNIETKGGALGDMRVSKSKIAITDLDVQDHDTNSHIAIDASLAGPLRTALQVLSSKPLEYPQQFGIAAETAQGNTDVDVSFKFPLHKKLSVDQVNVAAKAKLTDVRLEGIVPDFALSGGPMDLTLKNSVLNVAGTGFLDAIPIQFDAQKDFKANAEISAKVDAQLALTPASLVKFGAPENLMVSGSMPTHAVYQVGKDGSGFLHLNANVAGAGLALPVVNYEKKEGVSGQLDLGLRLNTHRQLLAIEGLNYQAEGASLKGNIEFSADSKTLKKASIQEAKLGATDIAVNIEAANNGYVLKITGKQFDASGFLGDDKKKEPSSTSAQSTPSAAPPLSVVMLVSRLITGKEENRALEKVRLSFARDGWARTDRLELDGTAGQKPITVRYLPINKGHSLRFEAQNAGAALAVLGITKGMRGGHLTVTGNPHANGSARDMQGTMIVNNFTLVEVPVLGRLLNAMSLSGIVELLNGKGIAFRKARANFEWIDQGLPDAPGAVRRIRVKDGETAGASLGLTYEGNIDMAADTLDIDGTIIPVSDINKLVSSIPVVGQILTGGGNAVFAATYTVRGPKAQPIVQVNPLSVLAPGIIRKLFFEQ